jgi:hypothetical protein
MEVTLNRYLKYLGPLRASRREGRRTLAKAHDIDSQICLDNELVDYTEKQCVTESQSD